MQTKKLKSLQDVIKLWVSKGAVINKRSIDGFGIYSNYLVQLHSGNSIIERVSIYEILYSPESNFFEVLFPGESIKACCVTSLDQLQYLLDNLNESTSS